MSAHETGAFGDLLRTLREEAGLTQEDLAERSGLSRDAISALERGRRKRPHPPTLAALGDALGLSAEARDALRRATRAPAPVAVADVQPGPVATARFPSALTNLIGRRAELAELTELVTRADTRLVTITGPGGVGKTRLSIELAHRLAPDLDDRVAFVPLGVIGDASYILPAVAEVAGVRNPGGGALIEQIARVLGDRDFLLVLDNLEHLPDAATTIAALLRACPALRVLATSRSRLRLSDEREFPLQPLGTGDAQPTEDAVELFVERAKLARPDFELTSRNSKSIRAICRRLDGLPLAIELAAARVTVLPPEALLARLDTGIELLSGGPRDQHVRLQSVRSAIAWSVELLDDREQAAFRALSVFVGEFSLTAAEVVLGEALGLDQLAVLEAIASLIDKSLIRPARAEGDEARYAMLFTIRVFGVAELEASAYAEAVHRAHAAYVIATAEAAAEAFRHLAGAEQWPWFQKLERERNNARSALGWLHEHGQTASMLRLTTALAWFWYVRGPSQEGSFWLERAVAMPTGGVPPELRPRALVGKALLDLFLGRMDEAHDALTESLDTAPDPPEPWWVASAELFLGMVSLARGAYEFADECLQRAHDGYLAIRHPINATIALGHRAAAAWGAGQTGRGLTLCRETEATQRRLDDLWGLGLTLGYRALIESELGNHAEAAQALQENLEIRREAVLAPSDQQYLESGDARWQASDWSDISTSLRILAVLSLRQGEPETAARWFGAAAAMHERIGGPEAALPERAAFVDAESTAREALGQQEYGLRHEEGALLSDNQAIHYALATIDRLVAATAPPSPPAPLPKERGGSSED